MFAVRDVMLAVAACCASFMTALASYDEACNTEALEKFNLEKILRCGFSADSWAVWIPPNQSAFCARDSIDQSHRGDFVCYAVNSTADCRMTPYLYTAVDGSNKLERDLGDGTKSRSLILDTDNCKYLVQLECYPDGSVWRYVTYKKSWTQSEIDSFKTRVQKEKSLSFLKSYNFDCDHDKP